MRKHTVTGSGLYSGRVTAFRLFLSGRKLCSGSRLRGGSAQTVTLARNSPKALITSIEISRPSLLEAKRKILAAGLTNVQFQQADISNLSYGPDVFDHIFICFVLEHLPQSVEILSTLKNHLKEKGTITVIEGDHGSVYFHPDSTDSRP